MENKSLDPGKLKILIIDDEGDICYLLTTFFKHRKFITDHVNTLAQAEVQIREDQPHIVFLDNHMPDGLGIKFIDHIKENYPDIKIVVITAHDTAADKNRAMRKGADLFLPKPFTRDQVISAVYDLLKIPA